MIRGSFALADKIDLGSIIMSPSPDEIEKVKDIIKSIGGYPTIYPNSITHVWIS